MVARRPHAADSLTASKKQATCKGGTPQCGYHAQWGCTTCEEGKEDFKRCTQRLGSRCHSPRTLFPHGCVRHLGHHVVVVVVQRELTCLCRGVGASAGDAGSIALSSAQLSAVQLSAAAAAPRA